MAEATALDGGAGGPAKIGPNAVSRLAEAAADIVGEEASRRLFVAAGLMHHWRDPPTNMVPDDDVARLHKALHAEFGFDAAARIGARAGVLTAEYLLTNRIPRAAQIVLSLLPRRLAIRLLLKAIARHAWTFAGAGAFRWSEAQDGFLLELAGAPVSRRLATHEPACAYYAATFESLFKRVAGARITVREVECEATGAAACRFAVLLG